MGWRAPALALAAFVFCYFQAAEALVGHWASNSLYSFGFAVPLISAFVIWARWSELSALRPAPDYVLGLPLFGLGIALLILGHLGALITVQQSSMIVVIAALVLVFLGRRFLRALWFPIAYLFLMVPLWNYPIAQLQEPSRILSARLGTALLHLTRVPALREGTMIALPNVTLQVLQECSGVNQLVTFVAMALPAAYLFLRGAWRRVLLVVLSVGIAYTSNGIRIALVGWLAYHGMGDGNISALHLMEGLAVSVIGYAALGGALSFLARTSRPTAASTKSSIDGGRSRSQALEFAVIGLMVLAGGYRLLMNPSDVPLAQTLNTLPTQIEDWTVDSAAIRSVRFPALDDEIVRAYPTPSGERRFMGADDELVRAYRTSTGERARVYVGYHRAQRDGKELAGDASSALERVGLPVAVDLPTGRMTLKQVERQRGLVSRGVFFWYDLNGRVASSIYTAKGFTLLDALTRGRTNGAVVMVEWDCVSSTGCDASREKALGLIRALVPLLRSALPV